MPEDFAADLLERAVLAHFPEAASIDLARIPTGKFNTSYYVAVDGRELVMRIAPPRDAVFLFYERDMMAQEPQIHRLLRDHTAVPVAEIIACDRTHRVLPRDYMLMERLHGVPLTEAPAVDFDDVLRQMGGHLAQVHAITAEQYGYLGDHHPMDPMPTWAEAFADMWRRLIDDIRGVGGYDESEADDMLRLLDRYLDIFDRPVPASLLHMDVWHQNILVDDTGEVTGLIDWDRGLWGDVEIEFAVLDYCGISEPAFWEGYGRPRDLSPEARMRQRLYLLYEVQKYIVIRIGRGGDRSGADRYRQQCLELAAPL